MAVAKEKLSYFIFVRCKNANEAVILSRRAFFLDSRRRLNEKWIAAWKWIVTELDSYVGKFHPVGLKWHKS